MVFLEFCILELYRGRRHTLMRHQYFTPRLPLSIHLLISAFRSWPVIMSQNGILFRLISVMENAGDMILSSYFFVAIKYILGMGTFSFPPSVSNLATVRVLRFDLFRALIPCF